MAYPTRALRADDSNYPESTIAMLREQDMALKGAAPGKTGQISMSALPCTARF